MYSNFWLLFVYFKNYFKFKFKIYIVDIREDKMKKKIKMYYFFC